VYHIGKWSCQEKKDDAQETSEPAPNHYGLTPNYDGITPNENEYERQSSRYYIPTIIDLQAVVCGILGDYILDIVKYIVAPPRGRVVRGGQADGKYQLE
jgi:hypothetical protein